MPHRLIFFNSRYIFLSNRTKRHGAHPESAHAAAGFGLTNIPGKSPGSLPLSKAGADRSKSSKKHSSIEQKH
jgi:hypothetical protein